MSHPVVLDLNEEIESAEDDLLQDCSAAFLFDVNKRIDAAEKFHKTISSSWERNWELYLGDHWTTKPLSYKSYLVNNKIRSNIETIIGYTTDSKPKAYFIPPNEEQAKQIEELEKVHDSIWDSNSMNVKLSIAIRYAKLMQCGFFKVMVEENIKGEHEIHINIVHPSEMRVDPNATNEDDAEYMYWKRLVPLSYVRNNYERGCLVKASSSKDLQAERLKNKVNSPISNMSGGQVTSPASDNFYVIDNTLPPSSSPLSPSADPMVELIEYWCKDYEMEETTDVLEDGTTIFSKVAKYPGGRLLTICNNVPLQCVKHPYNHGLFPFIRIPSLDVGTFWGLDEISHLDHLQTSLNRVFSYVMEFIRYSGNCPWIYDQGCLTKPELLGDRPGLRIEKKQGSDVHREAPPQMPQYIFSYIQFLIDAIEDQMGVRPVLQGKRGSRSGVALDTQQEAALIRLRPFASSLDMALRRMGKMIVSLVKQYYTETRIIQVLGRDGTPQFFEFDGKNIVGDWDMRVVTAAGMPPSRSARFQQAGQLFNQKAIDQQAYLEAADWPNRDKIIARMQNQPQQQALPTGKPNKTRPPKAGGKNINTTPKEGVANKTPSSKFIQG
jgi:hypothetical protein